MPARKVIITCAVTGSAHTPTMSPNLPVHRRGRRRPVGRRGRGRRRDHPSACPRPEGRPARRRSPAVFLDYLKGIKDSTDAVVSITSGGGTGMSVEDRLRVIYETRPELCTLNLGTFNYGSFPMIPKYAGSWKFDWEEPYLESTRAEPFVSTFADIEHMLTDVRTQTGSRFEYEAYDIGHLYTLAYYLEAGLVEPPIFLQTIMGVMGGIGAERRAPRPHEVDRRPAARRRLRVVGARRRAPPVRHDHRLGGDGLARPRRARGRPVHRPRSARRVERRAGRQDQADPRPSCRSRSPRRTRRARSSGSRASTRSAGEPAGRRRRRTRSGRSPSSAPASSAAAGPPTSCGRGTTSSPGTPGPTRADRLAGLLDTAWPSLERLGLRRGRRPRPAAVRGHARGGARRRRLRPGVLAGGAAGQGRAARRDRPADRPGGRRRLEHVRLR